MEKQLEPRSNKIFLYVGNRDVGKTSYVKESIRNSPQPKTLIVDTFDSPVWRNMKTHFHPEWESEVIPVISPDQVKKHLYGLYRTFTNDTDTMQKIIARDCMNTAVVIEDASRYFDSQLSKDQRHYLLDSKQRNVDYHLIFHLLSDIPPRLAKLANYLTLFKTGEITVDKSKFAHPDVKKALLILFDHPDEHINVTLKIR